MSMDYVRLNRRSVLPVMRSNTHVVNKRNVKIFAAKVGVSVCRLDFKNAFLNLKDGDIEGTTPQIVNSDDLVFRLVQTICKSGGSRFINDTQDIEASNGTGVLRGLALRVVEVPGFCHGSD
ncbi:MAG: NAD-specific glutamate dehydrogenase-domain-containing protein [Olpidium bornovanus]|uniref:NAD-specific glutamate dehydrogenase-domain-containing protein n=1 Tax=Olpidium bornovanus TaxID=278681 RepID=A0A8H7ZKW1_9FUNG|nr:MAG: NAD-specific glutamate dehydrogenase-domain-containing protein [Olpidium bornovanus]